MATAKSAAGVSRTVKLGSMAYKDPDGQWLRAELGEKITIDPEFAETFDALNVLQGQDTPKQSPEPPPPAPSPSPPAA